MMVAQRLECLDTKVRGEIPMRPPTNQTHRYTSLWYICVFKSRKWHCRPRL